MAAPQPERTPPLRISAEQYRALAHGRRQAAAKPASRKQWSRGVAQAPVRIALPFLPPSVNKLFTTVRDPASGVIKRVLTSNARRIRKLICAMVSAELDPTRVYELRIDIYLNAWTRAGKVRRVDLTNRVKFLEDCVCTALGIDDSHVFRVIMEKHDADQERTVVNIRAIEAQSGEARPGLDAA